MRLPPNTEPLFIPGPAGNLEAVIERPQTQIGNTVAIICHPHPKQEGTMTNKVVTTLVRACQQLGIIAVRFNFRGVGKSEGHYDHTIGEQDDLKAVISWVKETFPDCKLWLAGFSFGSYITAKVASEISIEQLISIAPPVNHFDFQSLPTIQCPWLVVQGELDEVVPSQEVFDWAETRSEKIHMIRMPNVGHFFHGKLIELRDNLVNSLTLNSH